MVDDMFLKFLLIKHMIRFFSSLWPFSLIKSKGYRNENRQKEGEQVGIREKEERTNNKLLLCRENMDFFDNVFFPITFKTIKEKPSSQMPH